MNTRDHILNAAYDLFIKKGYHKTTTRDIALAADVNLGLIPYHFGKKINLGVEAYSVMMQRIGARLDFTLIPLGNLLEEYYFGYLMIQYYLMINEHIYRFYTEFLESSDLQLVAQFHTSALLEKIIPEYHLNVTEEQLSDYHSMFFGAERALITKKNAGMLHMSYFEINATLARIMLHMIGIDRDEMELAIKNVNENIKNIPFDWSLLD